MLVTELCKVICSEGNICVDSLRNVIITFFYLCAPLPDTATAKSHMGKMKALIWKWILLISHLFCFTDALIHQY